MICLSFDTDHLDEGRMAEFLSEVPIPGSATFFCTQSYPGIDDRHELGPHMIMESFAGLPEALDAAREMLPAATGFRAHGCMHSHALALELGRRGYTYVSTQDQLGRPGIVPFREAWGVWQLPIYYADNLDISYVRHWDNAEHTPFARDLLEAALDGDSLYVFSFHPIHLMLNTTSVDEYLSRRDAFRAGEKIEQIRCTGYGIRGYYEDLTGLMEERGLLSVSMSDALQRFSSLSSAAS